MQQLPQNAIQNIISVWDHRRWSGLERLAPAVGVDMTLDGEAVGAGGHGAVVQGFERMSGGEGEEGADGEDGGGEEAHLCWWEEGRLDLLKSLDGG